MIEAVVDIEPSLTLLRLAESEFNRLSANFGAGTVMVWINKFIESRDFVPAGITSPRLIEAVKNLKNCICRVKAVNDQMAIEAIEQHLMGEHKDYSPLIDYLNHIVQNRGNNPRFIHYSTEPKSIKLDHISHLELWCVKEGLVTIVFRLRAFLNNGEKIKLVVQVAKDQWEARQKLESSFRAIAQDYAWNPHGVMEPFALGSGRVTTCRGEEIIPIMVGEWLDDFHELQLVGGPSSIFEAWRDQKRSIGTLSKKESRQIWQQITRLRALYSRSTSQGAIVSQAHIEAGDFVGRLRPDRTWEVMQVWQQRSPSVLYSDSDIVLNILLQGPFDFIDPTLLPKVMPWRCLGCFINAFVEGSVERDLYRSQVDCLGLEVSQTRAEARKRAIQLLRQTFEQEIPRLLRNADSHPAFSRYDQRHQRKIASLIKSARGQLGRFLLQVLPDEEKGEIIIRSSSPVEGHSGQEDDLAQLDFKKYSEAIASLLKRYYCGLKESLAEIKILMQKSNFDEFKDVFSYSVWINFGHWFMPLMNYFAEHQRWAIGITRHPFNEERSQPLLARFELHSPMVAQNLEIYRIPTQWQYPFVVAHPLSTCQEGAYLPLMPLFLKGQPLKEEQLKHLGIEKVKDKTGKPLKLPFFMAYVLASQSSYIEATRRVVHIPYEKTLLVVKTKRGYRILRTIAEKKEILFEANLEEKLAAKKRELRQRFSSLKSELAFENIWNFFLTDLLYETGLAALMSFVAFRYKGVGSKYIGRFVHLKEDGSAPFESGEELIFNDAKYMENSASIGFPDLIGKEGIFLDIGHQERTHVPVGAAASEDVLAIERDRLFLDKGIILSVINLDYVPLLNARQVPELTVDEIYVTTSVVLDTTLTLYGLTSHQDFYHKFVGKIYGLTFTEARLKHLEALGIILGKNLGILLELGFTTLKQALPIRKDMSAFGGLKDTGGLVYIKEGNEAVNIVYQFLDSLFSTGQVAGFSLEEIIQSDAFLDFTQLFLHAEINKNELIKYTQSLLKKYGEEQFITAVSYALLRLYEQVVRDDGQHPGQSSPPLSSPVQPSSSPVEANKEKVSSPIAKLTFSFSINEERTTALKLLELDGRRLVESKYLEITELLKSDDFIVREVAIFLAKRVALYLIQADLQSLPKKLLTELLTLLDKISPNTAYETRKAVAHAKARIILNIIPEKQALSMLELMSRDDNINVRIALVETLGEIGSEEALTILEVLSKDTHPWVRREVPFALANIGSDKALSILREMSKDTDCDVSEGENLAKALGNIGTEEAISILREMIRHPNSLVCYQVAKALGNIGSEETLSILKEMSDITWPASIEVARAKVRIISNIYPQKQALPILQNLSRDIDDCVRRGVAEGLVEVDIETAFSILEELSKDSNRSVRKSAAEALGKIGTEEALSILREMSKDADKELHEEVAKALGNIGTKEALSILREMIKDADRELLKAIAKALGNIGTEEALSILESELAYGGEDVIFRLKQRPQNRQLLTAQNPAFATVFTEELRRNFLALEEISKILIKHFKDDFTGIVIFGSAYAGWFTPVSDLDYCIIVSEKGLEPVHMIFEGASVSVPFQLFDVEEELPLGHRPFFINSEEYSGWSKLELLFCGLFFGDRQKLLDCQRRIFSGLSPEEWDKLRSKIRENVSFKGVWLDGLGKAVKRFGIPESEEEELTWKIVLNRVPPAYEEMKQLLGLSDEKGTSSPLTFASLEFETVSSKVNQGLSSPVEKTENSLRGLKDKPTLELVDLAFKDKTALEELRRRGRLARGEVEQALLNALKGVEPRSKGTNRYVGDTSYIVNFLYALGRLKDSASIPVVKKVMFTGVQHRALYTAAYALVQFGNKGINELLKLIKIEKDPDIRWLALTGLSAVKKKYQRRVIEHLSQIFAKETDRDIRKTIIEAILKFLKKSGHLTTIAKPVILKALGDQEWSIRWNAIKFFREKGDMCDIPYLSQAKEKEDATWHKDFIAGTISRIERRNVQEKASSSAYHSSSPLRRKDSRQIRRKTIGKEQFLISEKNKKILVSFLKDLGIKQKPKSEVFQSRYIISRALIAERLFAQKVINAYEARLIVYYYLFPQHNLRQIAKFIGKSVDQARRLLFGKGNIFVNPFEHLAQYFKAQYPKFYQALFSKYAPYLSRAILAEAICSRELNFEDKKHLAKAIRIIKQKGRLKNS